MLYFLKEVYDIKVLYCCLQKECFLLKSNHRLSHLESCIPQITETIHEF